MNLSAILDKILNAEFDHSNIVQEAKNSAEFREQVIDFATHIFNIKDELDSIDSILQSDYFIQALSELNIQLYAYSRFKLILEEKKNYYVHPLVISLLLDDDGSVLNLYHQNYKEIAPEHLNTSLEFIEKNGKCSFVEYLEDTLKILIENLPDTEKAKLQEKFQIVEE